MSFWKKTWERLKVLGYLLACIGMVDMGAHSMAGFCLNPLTYAAKYFASVMER